ncbi:CHAT domain-containing protein [Stackebrandtia soli]|uniref:CHAT domain-containing protein n=1 Tax=Stackebrandtia soli TaxID=1892856 RepID=UPI0039EA163B
MRALTPDELAEAWRLQQAGVEHQNSGRLERARELLRGGLRLTGWTAGDVGPADTARVTARLLISLSYAEAYLGSTQDGLALLDHAEQLTADEDRGILVHQRGLLLWFAGRWQESFTRFNEAEPLLRRHGPAWLLGNLLLNRAGVLGDLKRHREARESLAQCAAIADDENLPLLHAKATHSLGLVEHYLGNVPEALRLLAEASQWYERHSPDLLTVVKGSQARALLDAGLVKEARNVARAARELEEQPTSERIQLNAQIAVIALEMGDWDEAIQCAREGRKLAIRHERPILAVWMERLELEAILRSGNVTEEFARNTVDLMERQRSFGIPGFAQISEVLAARALIAVDRLNEAEKLLSTGALANGPSAIAIRLNRELARAELAVRRGDRPRAQRYIRNGLSLLHRHRSRLGSIELQAGVSSLGRQLAERGLGLALESGRASTAFSWSERVRAQAYRLPTVSLPEDPRNADMLAQLRKLRHQLSSDETHGRADPTKLAECRRLERTLRERSWQTPRTGDTVPLAKGVDVRRRLTVKDEVLVSYLQHDGTLHALVLDGERTHLRRLGTAAESEELARRLRADLSASTGRRLPERMAATVRASIARLAEKVDNALLAPIAALVGDRDLVIIPTGTLTTLPWALLPSLRGRPVTVTPSASLWTDISARSARSGGRVILAAGPGLVHAEAEMDAIAALYPDPLVLRDGAAGHREVLSSLDGAATVHLAAHGHHEPDNVQFSRLDFADGPLMAYDIVRLGDPPARVTLSACDVGEATVASGDETLGFTSALLYAGTGTVVSSGVKVEHQAAVDVMTTYHRGLAAGHRPARALAEASERQAFSPFVCYGAS